MNNYEEEVRNERDRVLRELYKYISPDLPEIQGSTEGIEGRGMTFEEAMEWSREQKWPELEVEGIDKDEVYTIHAMIEMENEEDCCDGVCCIADLPV